MKNYQIFNAYSAFTKIAELNYKDYDINVDVALMLSEIEVRYKIIIDMINKLYKEYCQAKNNQQYFLDEAGNPLMKPGKSLDEFNAEMDKISNADANYDPEKIIIYRDSFKDEMPNPKDMAALKDFVVFEKEDRR